ncbi:MAG: T9SS type A sorting domain-containing protein [Cytophagaceae bacterium]
MKYFAFSALSLSFLLFACEQTKKDPQQIENTPQVAIGHSVPEVAKASFVEDLLPEIKLSSDVKAIKKAFSAEEKKIKLASLLTRNYMVENKGQLERYYQVDYKGVGEIKYFTNVLGGAIYFGNQGIGHAFHKKKHHTGDEIIEMEQLSYNVSFPGMNRDVTITAQDKLEGEFNIIAGNNPENHFSGIGHFNTLLYKNIYNKIDLKYYHTGEKLKYDFILKPGADVKDIEMAYQGVDGLSINSGGELEISIDWGKLIDEKPYAYQLTNGQKREVPVKFYKKGAKSVGFKVTGNYDKNLDLIIDPPTVNWASYVTHATDAGANSYINDMDVDASGNLYFTGWVNSIMPGISTTLGTSGRNEDIMVYKMNETGTSVLYGTIVAASGLNSSDVGTGISVNSAGEAYVTGYTTSTDFPAVGTSSISTHSGARDIVVFRLNAAGNALNASTYYGGAGQETGHDIVADPHNANLAHFCGQTMSSGLGTGGSAYNAGHDGFVGTFNATTGAVVTFTYVGGTGDDVVKAMDLYNGGTTATTYIYLSGTTNSSTNIATAGTYRTTAVGSNDVFVMKYNRDLNTKMYGTYLGGCCDDWAGQIRVTRNDEAIVIGHAEHSTFPTTYAFQASPSTGNEAFLAGFNSTGTTLMFSTFIGGTGSDNGIKGRSYDIAQYWRPGGLDVNDSIAMLTFITTSTDLGTTNPVSYTTAAGPVYSGATAKGSFDVYVAMFNFGPAKRNQNVTRYFSSYFGVAGNTNMNYPTGGIRQDKRSSSSCFYVGMAVHAVNLPTTAGVYQPVSSATNANDKPFIVKLCDPILPVNLINFNGKLKDGLVELNWSTASEKNNDYFEILKSSDGVNFTSIGTVKGNGNSNHKISYQYYDYSPSETGNYYKLKQVDYDGKSEYSSTIHVGNAGSNSIKVVKKGDEYQLLISSDASTEVKVNVYSLEGRQILATSIFVQEGSSIHNLDLPSSGRGIYMLQAIMEGEVFGEKLVVE